MKNTVNRDLRPSTASSGNVKCVKNPEPLVHLELCLDSDASSVVGDLPGGFDSHDGVTVRIDFKKAVCALEGFS